VAAAGSLDWQELRKQLGTKGTEWILTPKGSSWREGQAERAIRSARETLSRILTKGTLLDIHQFDAALHQVAGIINLRPLAVRLITEDTYHAISPSDILLGRAARARPILEELEELEEDESLIRAADHQQEVVQEWWRVWMDRVFPDLVPRQKWKNKYRNVSVGNIAMLKYSSKFSIPQYRLCKVSAVFPDKHGVVRTCEVVMRQRRIKEDGSPSYKVKKLVPLVVGVQRLSVQLPVECQGEVTTPNHVKK
jgi:hypothetical protein